jgi:hypothetical protein
MMPSRSRAPLALIALVVACGGSAFTAAGDGGDAGTDGSVSVEAAGGNDSSEKVDATPAAACPDVTGSYAIAVPAPPMVGCGDVNPLAKQCITAAAKACDVLFVSASSTGAGTAINSVAGSPVTLDAAGDFPSASLNEGTAKRSGCTGSWNAATATMTVDCGGMDPMQGCVLALRRTDPTCK